MRRAREKFGWWLMGLPWPEDVGRGWKTGRVPWYYRAGANIYNFERVLHWTNRGQRKAENKS